MEPSRRKVDLPPIPAKRYFTIGEVSELCGVKPHVLRYWEQEFTQLKPVKRRGNRRYYQHHEVLLIRRIRELLYEEGFTISGARNRLDNAVTGDDKHEARAARAAGILEAVARAVDGETVLVEQFADATDQQHLVVLVVTPIAATLQRLQLSELLLPVPEYMGFHPAKLAYFPDREIALRGNGRKVIRCQVLRGH